MFPFIMAAIVLVSLTAYAACAVSGNLEDYTDPADWDDEYE